MSFIEVTLDLLSGFGITCLLFILTLLFALPLGLLVAFCSMSKFKPLKVVTRVFVWIVRGVPLMLQILIIVYLPGLLFKEFNIWSVVGKFFFNTFGIQFGNKGATFGEFIAVVIAFTINYACYFSEIYRGGIENTNQGQFEAGKVLGMTKGQIFYKIVLLQVIKRIVPPMSNEIITLVKDTALSNIISVMEIIFVAQDMLEKAIWPLFYSGAFYLIFIGILTILFGRLEKKLSYFKA